MGTCKWCGKSGWLVRVTKNGMCAGCHDTHTPRVLGKLRRVGDSIAIVDSGEVLKKRVERCEEIVRIARQLIPYEDRGIPLCNPPPSELIPRYEEELELLLLGRRISYAIFWRVDPLTEDYNKPLKIKSFSSNRSYFVNLHEFTCTCPDFQERRRHVPPGKFNRLCKHIAEAFSRHGRPDGWSEVHHAIISRSFGMFKDRYFIIPLNSGIEIALGYEDDYSWLDVFARSRRTGEKKGLYTGRYHRYGFNYLGPRWSYGEGPPGAMEIRRIIRALALRLNWPSE